MVKTAQSTQVGVLLGLDLLDGHFLLVQIAFEDAALSPTAQPLQVTKILEGDILAIAEFTVAVGAVFARE